MLSRFYSAPRSGAEDSRKPRGQGYGVPQPGYLPEQDGNEFVAIGIEQRPGRADHTPHGMQTTIGAAGSFICVVEQKKKKKESMIFLDAEKIMIRN